MSGHGFTFDEFEAQLTIVLQRLYDPSLHPAEVVFNVLGVELEDRLDALQTAIIQAVEDLRPADYVPKTTRSWRMYSILFYRFISNLPQEEVAERVWITPRHLRREQINAVRLLALKLWEKAQLPAPLEPEAGGEREDEITASLDTPKPALDETSPEKQLQSELQALQESAPGVISNIFLVVKSVLALVRRFPGGEMLHVKVEELPEDLNLALHPSALRQVLWMILHQVLNRPRNGEIVIHGGVAGKMGTIEMVISPAFEFDPQRLQIIQDILGAQNGKITIDESEGALCFRIELLNVDRRVLVVEDNPDIVHLYQRYLMGTRYSLVHQSTGEGLLERIEEIRPAAVVLDIMLPDVDGWDLLTRLMELPETRSIPVIVSSVVSDPDLAKALGAAVCLAKPVQRQELILALDQVTAQA